MAETGKRVEEYDMMMMYDDDYNDWAINIFIISFYFVVAHNE